MATLVTGLFRERATAEAAVDALGQAGIARDDVSVLMSESTRDQHFADGGTVGNVPTKVAEGAGTGAAIGGTLGGIAGALTLAAGNLFLPGVGLLAAGPLLAALAGAGAGGLAGTLVGALVGMGIPDEEAAQYHSSLESGGILIGAHVPDSMALQTRTILENQGALETRFHDVQDGHASAPLTPPDAGAGSALNAASVTGTTDSTTNTDTALPETSATTTVLSPAVGVPPTVERAAMAATGTKFSGGNDMATDDIRNNNTNDAHVPASEVAGAHEADGTMGRTAGTGSGAISGGIVGAAVGGPVGAVVGAVAGGVLGAAAGDAAHNVGDDHDDVNVDTGSDGTLGRDAGTGAGAVSGAIVGTAAAGPVGTVAGAVAGGMLGAAAGDGAKDMGGDGRVDNDVADNRTNTGRVV